MYCDFFGLRRRPFEDRADTQFFFPRTDCEEALAAIEYAVCHGKGTSLLLGESGTGKTLLVRILLRRLDDSDQVVVLACPPAGEMDLFRETAKRFGVSLSSSNHESQCLDRLRRHLIRAVRAKRRPILVVDQAENLTPEKLAQLEALTDLEHGGERLLSIVLAGQPRLRETLDVPQLARLAQRFHGECLLSPLTQSETGEYVRHRLKSAGAKNPNLFDARAVTLIHEASRGIPRLVNHLCDAAMLAAFGAGEPHISGDLAAEVTGNVRTGRPSVDGHAGGVSASTDAHPPASPQVDEYFVAGTREAARRPEGSFDRVEKRLNTVLQRCEDRLLAIDAAMIRVSELSDDAREQQRSMERICARADRVESRLKSFLEQVADKVDEVQGRIESLITTLGAVSEARAKAGEAQRKSDEARAKLEKAVERSTSVAVEIEKRLDGLRTGLDKTKAEAESFQKEFLDNALRRCREKLQEQTEVHIRRQHDMAESTFREQRTRLTEMIDDSASRVRTLEESIAARQREIEMQLEAQASIDELTRRSESTGKNLLGVICRGEKLLPDVQATCTRIEDAQRCVSSTLVEIERACERVGNIHKQAAQNKELSDRLALRRAEAVKTAEQLEEVGNSMRQLLHELQKSITSAAQQVGRLDSQGTSASRIIENLQAANATAKSAIEKIEDAVHKVEDAAKATNEQIALLDSRQSETQATARQLEELGSSARQVHEALQGLVAHAEEKVGRLDSHHAAAAQTIENLQAANATAESAIEKIKDATQNAEDTAKTTNEQAATLATKQNEAQTTTRQIDELTSSARQVHEALQGLVAHAEEKVGRLDSHHAAASNVLRNLSDATVNGHNLIERIQESKRTVDETIDRVTERIDQLVERVSAASSHAEVKTKELAEQNDKAGNLLGELATTAPQAQEAGTKLTQRMGEAKQHAATLAESCSQAGKLSERLTAQISAAQESIKIAAPLLSEFITRARNNERQLAVLQEQTSQIQKTLNEATARPAQVVAKAQAQAAQLERVCAAVRKVFAGLSQASLEARKHAQESRQTNEQASKRLSTLVAETNRATNTLREWIEEALRAHSRLERTLQHCPSIHETHPGGALRRVSQAMRDPLDKLGNPSPLGDLEMLGKPSTACPPAEPRSTSLASRAEEVSAMIKDAKQAAEYGNG